MLNKNNKIKWILFIIIVASAAIKVAMCILGRSLDQDEAYSFSLSQMSFGGIINATAHDVHPPLYYLILKIWVHFFGTSEVALRSPSIVLSLITIPLVFLVIKKLLNESVAIWSAGIFAFNPFYFRLATSARMYPLLFLLLLTAIYSYTELKNEKNTFRWRLLFIASLTCALLTHYFAWLTFFSLFICSAFNIHADSKTKHRYKFFNFLYVFMLITPWLATMYKHLSQLKQGYWVPPITADIICASLIDIFGGSFCFISFLGLLSLSMICKSKDLSTQSSKEGRLLIIINFLLPFLVTIIFSLLHTPLFVIRFLALPAFFGVVCLLQVMLNGAPRHYQNLLGCAVTLTLIFQSIRDIKTLSEHDWENVATYIQTKATSGDAVIVCLETRAKIFRYYQTRNDISVYSLLERESGTVHTELAGTQTLQNLEKIMASHSHIWYIDHHCKKYDPLNIIVPRISSDFSLISNTDQFNDFSIDEYKK